jgi:glycosyltransferase involved in cell wall biosynthesis
MSLPVVFDITHLVSRRQVWPRTGIDRVDEAFANGISERTDTPLIGLHCGVAGPRLVGRKAIRQLVDEVAVDERRAGFADEQIKHIIREWLSRDGREASRAREFNPLGATSTKPSPLFRLMSRWQWLFANREPVTIPPGAIYVNAAPYGTPGPYYFRWLMRRRDVAAAFFVHDLLPIDHPEYFPRSWQPSFRRMNSTVMRRADALLVASEAMRSRAAAELARFGRNDVPIHVSALPPPLAFTSPDVDQAMRRASYFIASGTIEPRKNHLLLLQLWQRFADASASPPRLILVGGRGWENHEVRTLLDRHPALSGSVLEVGGVSDNVHRWLLSNACAALYPSFAEGYGLPVVEALALGVPTVVSDIPVLRETSQRRAVFCDPLNADQWHDAVSRLAERSSSPWAGAASMAGLFKAPRRSDYFNALLEFLQSVRA